MILTKKVFPYATAAESAKPGYLERRFAQIRREQEAERKRVEAAQAETERKVTKIKGAS